MTNDGLFICVVGAARTGKSQWVRAFVENKKNVIWVDPYEVRKLKVLKNYEPIPKFNGIFCANPYVFINAKKSILILDDIRGLSDEGFFDREGNFLADLGATRGHNHNIIIAVFHSFTAIPPKIYTHVTDFVVFPIKNARQTPREKQPDFFGEEFLEKLKKLEKMPKLSEFKKNEIFFDDFKNGKHFLHYRV